MSILLSFFGTIRPIINERTPLNLSPNRASVFPKGKDSLDETYIHITQKVYTFHLIGIYLSFNRYIPFARGDICIIGAYQLIGKESYPNWKTKRNSLYKPL